MISSDVRHVGICLNLFGLLSRKIKLFDILGVMLHHPDHSVGSSLQEAKQGLCSRSYFPRFRGDAVSMVACVEHLDLAAHSDVIVETSASTH